MTDHINKVHNYPCSVCSWCPKTHDILQNYWENGSNGEEVFCEFGGTGEYSSQAIFRHIDSKHKKIQTIQSFILLVLLVSGLDML